jgi:hypothetical protein
MPAKAKGIAHSNVHLMVDSMFPYNIQIVGYSRVKGFGIDSWRQYLLLNRF